MAEVLEKENVMPAELEHLARLLDDENDFVYTNVRERFITHGKNTVIFLKNYANSDDPLVSARAQEIISLLNFEELEIKFKEAAERSDKNLLEDAVFLLASYGYPGISVDNYSMILDKMAMDIENIIYSKDYINSPAIDTIELINEYLFDKKGFTGNTADYYNPDNSYMNKVIDLKTGIPVSLSVLYMLLAKRLNLPIYGINIPSHFIIKYQDAKEEFFIDTYNKGIVITKDEAINFLGKLGMTQKDFDSIPFLKIADDKEIIARMIKNLVKFYEKKKDYNRTDQLKKIASYFE